MYFSHPWAAGFKSIELAGFCTLNWFCTVIIHSEDRVSDTRWAGINHALRIDSPWCIALYWDAIQKIFKLQKPIPRVAFWSHFLACFSDLKTLSTCTVKFMWLFIFLSISINVFFLYNNGKPFVAFCRGKKLDIKSQVFFLKINKN